MNTNLTRLASLITLLLFSQFSYSQFEDVNCQFTPGVTSVNDITCQIVCGQDVTSVLLSEEEIATRLGTGQEITATYDVQDDLCTQGGIIHVVSWARKNSDDTYETFFTQAYRELPIPLESIITDSVEGSHFLGGFTLPFFQEYLTEIGLTRTEDGAISLDCSISDYSPESLSTQYDDPSTVINEGALIAFPTIGIDINSNGEIDGWEEVFPLAENGSCNLIHNYSDTEFSICSEGDKSKVLRQWQIIDWCTGDLITLNQLFYTGVLAFNPNEPGLVEVSIQPWTCVGDLVIPDLDYPVVGCSSSFEMYIEINGNQYEVGDQITLDEGSYSLNYYLSDPCSRIILSKTVEVIDRTPPVPVCQDELDVKIIGRRASLAASSFDSGSHDAGCGPTWFKIIRLDELNGSRHGYWNDGQNYDEAPSENPAIGCSNSIDDFNSDVPCYTEGANQVFFDDEVTFCRADTDAPIFVVMRVFDVDPGSGPVLPFRMDDANVLCDDSQQSNDLTGRYNDCMVKVNVSSLRGMNNLTHDNEENEGQRFATEINLRSDDHKEVNIFPNPVDDILFIQGSESAYTFSLYAVTGKLIGTYSNRSQVDLSELQSGIYLLDVKDKHSNSHVIHRVVKK